MPGQSLTIVHTPQTVPFTQAKTRMKAVFQIAIPKTRILATQAMLTLNRAYLRVADTKHRSYRLRAVGQLKKSYLRNKGTPVQTLLRRAKRPMRQS